MPTSNPIEVFYLTFKPWWIVNPPSSSHACNRNCRLTFSTAPKFFNVLKFAAWPEYNNIFTSMTNEKSAHNTLSRSPVKMCPKTPAGSPAEVVYAGFFFLQGTFTKKVWWLCAGRGWYCQFYNGTSQWSMVLNMGMYGTNIVHN